MKLRTSSKTWLIACSLAALAPSPVSADGEPPCDVLHSPQGEFLSGPGEQALRSMCGEAVLPSAAAATPPLAAVEEPSAPSLLAVFGLDVLVNNPLGDPPLSTTQSETTLAITGGTLVGAWNDSSSFAVAPSGNGYAVSTDLGTTWVDRGPLLPTGVVSVNFGDPWLRAHDTSGNFYYATLAQDFRGASLIAVYSGATPGVAPDWPAVADVTPGQAGFQDKEAMDVDNSGGPFDGRVYVCWRQFGGTNNIKLSRNQTMGPDLALSHLGVVDISPIFGAETQGCYVEVDQATGDVYVAWEDLGSPRSIRARRSVNGGATFGPDVTVATLVPIGTVSPCCGRQVMNGEIRVLEFISSMTVSATTGNLHVVFASDGDGVGVDRGDVFHVRCSPAGANSVGACTAPLRLNSDATTRDQWHPTIDAAPSGDLAVFWYDRRDDPANLAFDVYKRFSRDDGATFTPDEKVTDVPSGVPLLCPNFDPIIAPCYMGEYNHVVSDADNFYFIWGDNRNLLGLRPDPDVFFEVEPVVDNQRPKCDLALADPGELWPDDHKFADVAIIGVTDEDEDPISITIESIFQDEPVLAVGDGNTAPDGAGVGTDTASVRAERSGTPKLPGDGRVYTIGFSAEDGKGGACQGSVTVCVPHDQGNGNGEGCVDGGAFFNSTGVGGCGLGFELALVLPPLLWLHRRRRRPMR